jgi:hypothetical protein
MKRAYASGWQMARQEGLRNLRREIAAVAPLI